MSCFLLDVHMKKIGQSGKRISLLSFLLFPHNCWGRMPWFFFMPFSDWSFFCLWACWQWRVIKYEECAMLYLAGTALVFCIGYILYIIVNTEQIWGDGNVFRVVRHFLLCVGRGRVMVCRQTWRVGYERSRCVYRLSPWHGQAFHHRGRAFRNQRAELEAIHTFSSCV